MSELRVPVYGVRHWGGLGSERRSSLARLCLGPTKRDGLIP